MNLRDALRMPSSDVTEESVYRDRRRVLAMLGAVPALGIAGCSEAAPPPSTATVTPEQAKAGFRTAEEQTRELDATTYNNFYEFGTDKSDPARHTHRLITQPWTVEVEGLVKTPRKFSLDDLLKLSPLEERIYRLRCVEGWSMVIPWIGYSLSALLKKVEPLGSAKFVEFISLADPKTMPGVASRVLDWPYVEGLRLDEALHPLTLLGLGMYGDVLPKQNGAPVRLVVPWKYGFKSSKSIVKIRLVEHQPTTSWGRSAPREYGFYSNVNPQVNHPRWSQATERRIGEDGLFTRKRKTLLFNGYEEQVGQLYAGMDLQKNY